VALTLADIQDWLVDQCQSHLKVCGWSLERTESNPDLRIPIWNHLRRAGITDVSASGLATFDFSVILPSSELKFLVGCRIALKQKVLEHYLSQVTQVAEDERKDFDKRARLLQESLVVDEQLYSTLSLLAVVDGAFGDRITDRTNIPDAACIPYHP
jgi:hypothetical protein